ncbi:MAG: hypothetical protein ABSB40_09260 [Nitrososphaeria archaeon]
MEVLGKMWSAKIKKRGYEVALVLCMIVIVLAVVITNDDLATHVTIISMSYPSTVKAQSTFNITVYYSSVSKNLITTAQAYITTGQVGLFGPYTKVTVNMLTPGTGNCTLSVQEPFSGLSQVQLTFEFLDAIGLGLAERTVTLNVTSSGT